MAELRPHKQLPLFTSATRLGCLEAGRVHFQVWWNALGGMFSSLTRPEIEIRDGIAEDHVGHVFVGTVQLLLMV